MKRRRKWLLTNEREDAVRAMEWAAAIAPTVEKHPHNRKWLLLALQNALQGYMVVVLEKGNGLLALKPHIAKKWLAAYEGNGQYPFEKLDDFPALYEKVKNPKHFTHPFSPTLDQDRDVVRLNDLRADFSHFTPKGWRLDLAGLPVIVSNSLMLASWAITDAGANWYKASHIKRTKVAIRRLRRFTQRREG